MIVHQTARIRHVNLILRTDRVLGPSDHTLEMGSVNLGKTHIWSQIVFGSLSIFAASVSLIWLVGYTKGPTIHLVAPSYITIYSNVCIDQSYRFIEFIVPIVLINSGQVGQNDFLVEERMVLTIRDENPEFDGREIQYYGYQHVQTSDGKKTQSNFSCEEREDYEYPNINIKSVGNAGMGVVNGASATWREIHFVTAAELCDADGENCVTQEKEDLLLSQKFKSGASESMQFIFKFYVNFFRIGLIESNCHLKMHTQTLKQFKEDSVTTTACKSVSHESRPKQRQDSPPLMYFY